MSEPADRFKATIGELQQQMERAREQHRSTAVESEIRSGQRLRYPLVDDPIQKPQAQAMPDETTDLKIKLSEAQGEVRLAEALGEVRTGFAQLNERLAALDRSTSGLKAVIIGTGIAAVAVVVAMLAYGQTWFGIGVATRDIIRATVSEMNVSNQHNPTPTSPPSKP